MVVALYDRLPDFRQPGGVQAEILTCGGGGKSCFATVGSGPNQRTAFCPFGFYMFGSENNFNVIHVTFDKVDQHRGALGH